MDAVPFDFIERTVILANIANVQFWPYCDGATLQGNWGRFMKSINKDTVKYGLALLIDSNDLYYRAFQGVNVLRIEDLLEKKKTCVIYMYINEKQYYFSECYKMDDQKFEMIERLLKRSNGCTAMTMEQNLKMIPAVVALMDAIPRVNSMHSFLREGTEEIQTTEDVNVVLSFMKKHIQMRCLTRLNMSGIYSVSKIYFPLIRTFLQDAEFASFFGKFDREDKYFAKEVIRLIKANVRDHGSEEHNLWNQRLCANPTLFKELQEEKDYVEKQWPATLELEPKLEAMRFEADLNFHVSFIRALSHDNIEKAIEDYQRQRTQCSGSSL